MAAFDANSFDIANERIAYTSRFSPPVDSVALTHVPPISVIAFAPGTEKCVQTSAADDNRNEAINALGSPLFPLLSRGSRSPRANYANKSDTYKLAGELISDLSSLSITDSQIFIEIAAI